MIVLAEALGIRKKIMYGICMDSFRWKGSRIIALPEGNWVVFTSNADEDSVLIYTSGKSHTHQWQWKSRIYREVAHVTGYMHSLQPNYYTFSIYGTTQDMSCLKIDWIIFS